MRVESTLDHLVLVCQTVEQGIDYCERILGVRPPKGGQHARMGTHNHLLMLGGGTYLEVIAIDPDAAPLDRPRWFGMDAADNVGLQETPRLATFVARTNAIDAARDALPMLGIVTEMQRNALEWKITIRNDGAMIEGGSVPPLIQWPDGVDPTATMADLGCRLVRLEVFHPEPDRLRSAWRKIGLAVNEKLVILPSATGTAPYLSAQIDTPDGRKTLGGQSS